MNSRDKQINIQKACTESIEAIKPFKKLRIRADQDEKKALEFIAVKYRVNVSTIIRIIRPKR